MEDVTIGLSKIPAEHTYLVVTALRGPDIQTGVFGEFAHLFKTEVTTRLRAIVFTVEECKGNYNNTALYHSDLSHIYEVWTRTLRKIVDTKADLNYATYYLDSPSDPRAIHRRSESYTLRQLLTVECKAIDHYLQHAYDALSIDVIKKSPIWNGFADDLYNMIHAMGRDLRSVGI